MAEGMKGRLARGQERGVTLIEVLAAIGIIAVLVTLVMKNGSAFLDRGRAVKCTANLRQISAAMSIYQSDNNGLCPPVRAAAPDNTYWYQVLAPYLEGTLKSPTSSVGDTRDVAKVFRCPTARRDFGAPSDEAIYRSYMATDYMRSRDSSNTKDWSIPIRVTSIAKPASTLFLVDGAKTSSGTDYACDSGQSYASAKISYRHAKRTSALFCDGHVAFLTATDITKDMWDSP